MPPTILLCKKGLHLPNPRQLSGSLPIDTHTSLAVPARKESDFMLPNRRQGWLWAISLLGRVGTRCVDEDHCSSKVSRPPVVSPIARIRTSLLTEVYSAHSSLPSSRSLSSLNPDTAPPASRQVSRLPWQDPISRSGMLASGCTDIDPIDRTDHSPPTCCGSACGSPSQGPINNHPRVASCPAAQATDEVDRRRVLRRRHLYLVRRSSNLCAHLKTPGIFAGS